MTTPTRERRAAARAAGPPPAPRPAAMAPAAAGTTHEAQHAPSTLAVVSAFAAVYVVWGSTYLAILWAVQTLPPFLMAGTRFLLAGGAMYAWLRLRGQPAPARAEWRAAAIVGVLLLVFGNGLVVMAERVVPSGIAALIVASVPLWMVGMQWARPGGTRPAGRVLVGLAIGVLGIALLTGGPVAPDAAPIPLSGVLMLTVACASWAWGSLVSRDLPKPASAFLGSAMQMLAGGAVLLVLGLARGEAASFDPGAATARSWLSFLYLIVFGSLVGFSAYVWLLRHSTPARVGTYAYVNPAIAVLLGWLVAGEALTARMIVATVVIVGSVALITSAPTGAGGRRS